MSSGGEDRLGGMTVAENRNRWIALYVLCLGTLMIVLDTTIVNVALPSIRNSLGFSQTSLAWVVNAYLLTFGGLLLLGGRLGDLYGHRRLYVVGIGLFTVASLACGLSTDKGELSSRAPCRASAARSRPRSGLSLIMTLFTEPAERAKAMGVAGFVASGGGTIGVLLGGVLTDLLSWHWIFLVNVPIGVLVCVLVLRIVPGRGRPRPARRLDVFGAVTVTAALLLAVYAIVNGNGAGWTSAQTLGLPAGAAVLLGVFLVIEERVAAPLMPLRLFRRRNVASRTASPSCGRAQCSPGSSCRRCTSSSSSATAHCRSGWRSCPANLIMGVLSLGLSARLVMRFGIKRPLAVGLGLAAVGLLLFARAPVDGRSRPTCCRA